MILSMFIMSIVFLDLKKLQQITYPTDSDGKKCTLDHTNFNYLYFTSLTDAVFFNITEDKKIMRFLMSSWRLR